MEYCRSSRMQARKDSADVRVRGEGPLHQVQGDIPATANTTGTGGTAQNLWYDIKHILWYNFQITTYFKRFALRNSWYPLI